MRAFGALPQRLFCERVQSSRDRADEPVRSGLAKADPEATPMAAANAERRRRILEQHELAIAHVAAVGLQQERRRAGGRLLSSALLENAPVPAIGRVPDRIVALRM